MFVLFASTFPNQTHTLKINTGFFRKKTTLRKRTINIHLQSWYAFLLYLMPFLSNHHHHEKEELFFSSLRLFLSASAAKDHPLFPSEKHDSLGNKTLVPSRQSAKENRQQHKLNFHTNGHHFFDNHLADEIGNFLRFSAIKPRRQELWLVMWRHGKYKRGRVLSQARCTCVRAGSLLPIVLRPIVPRVMPHLAHSFNCVRVELSVVCRQTNSMTLHRACSVSLRNSLCKCVILLHTFLCA